MTVRTVHLAMNVAHKYRTRTVEDNADRTDVLNQLEALGKYDPAEGDSPWDVVTLIDVLRGVPEKVGVHDDAPRVMDVSISPDSTPLQALAEVVACWKISAVDESPLWVSSSDPGLDVLMRAQWPNAGTVPADVEATTHTAAGPPGEDNGHLWAGKPSAVDVSLADAGVPRTDLGDTPPDTTMLHTSAGIDLMSRVMFDTASNATSTYAAATYVAITADSAAPAAGDTALTSEQTTNGFARAQATYAHTNGTATAVMTKTFTSTQASGSTTINKAGLLNAASTGTLAYETAVPSPPALVLSDSVAFTWTMTLS